MMPFQKCDFGNDFAWGVSTASFQVEGGYNADGKGPSIWDDFTAGKGGILNDQNAKISCDFYHRFPKDLMTMSLMNIGHYRFSLSWSRLFPDGTGLKIVSQTRLNLEVVTRMVCESKGRHRGVSSCQIVLLLTGKSLFAELI